MLDVVFPLRIAAEKAQDVKDIDVTIAQGDIEKYYDKIDPPPDRYVDVQGLGRFHSRVPRYRDHLLDVPPPAVDRL